MAMMAMKASLEELPSSRLVPSRRHNFAFLNVGWNAGRVLKCVKEPKLVGESGGSLEEVPNPSKVLAISPQAAENAELPWNLRRRRESHKGESSKSVLDASGKGKRKVIVSLSLKEVEADFVSMNGKKPHKRPKKRPKHVQKQVDAAFPGMWLSDVTPDLYKVE
ncbi:uncharacterized protein LOC144551920 [Carex rostrata]